MATDGSDVIQPIVNITGEQISLGPLRHDLLPLYQRWHNDFATQRTYADPPEPTTIEHWAARYERWLVGADAVRFTLYERATLRPIGITNLHRIDLRNRTAAFGMLIGATTDRGKGYGTEATRLMLDYAFTALGLHNVMLTVLEFNRAGRRVYERAGFRECGRRREAHRIGGKWWDVISMDCLASESESPVLARIFVAEEPR